MAGILSHGSLKTLFFCGGTTFIGASVVGIGPIHLDPGGARGPTKWTRFLYGIHFTAQFLTKRSGMKKFSFMGQPVSAYLWLVLGPSTWILERP